MSDEMYLRSIQDAIHGAVVEAEISPDVVRTTTAQALAEASTLLARLCPHSGCARDNRRA